MSGGADWVKLRTDLFQNSKIIYIRSLPGGDTLALLWAAVLCAAGRANDGGNLCITCGKPHTEDSFAREYGFKKAEISRGFLTFSGLGMLEKDGDTWAVSGWYEHQNAEALDEKKAQAAQRAKAYRQRKRQAVADLEEYREGLEDA